MGLTPLPADERRRWANVWRRTHALGHGTNQHAQHAIDNRPIFGTAPIDAAEACLDTLEARATEPDPVESSP